MMLVSPNGGSAKPSPPQAPRKNRCRACQSADTSNDIRQDDRQAACSVKRSGLRQRSVAGDARCFPKLLAGLQPFGHDPERGTGTGEQLRLSVRAFISG